MKWTSQTINQQQESRHNMTIDERILFEMEAMTKKNNAGPGKSLKRDKIILFEMEAIKTKKMNAPRGEESRKRKNILRQLFAHVVARLFSKRQDRHRDQIHESQEAKNNVSVANKRRSRRKLNPEKKGICPKKSANLDARAFVSSKKLYKSSHPSDIGRNGNTDNQQSSDDETTEQEMSQSTTSSRRPKYTSFDEEEQELNHHINYSMLSLYSYKDSQNSSSSRDDDDDDDLSTCPSMSTMGGSSMISDWASANWSINGKGGGMTSEF